MRSIIAAIAAYHILNYDATNTTHTVTAFPLGNADSTRIDLDGGEKILIDFADVTDEDDASDKRIDLPEALREDLDDAGRDFLADAHAKMSMPEVVATTTGESDPRYGPDPSWPWAHEVVEQANANQKATAQMLKKASEQKSLLGRSASSK